MKGMPVHVSTEFPKILNTSSANERVTLARARYDSNEYLSGANPWGAVL
jgi:hypothetical protein